MEYEEWELDIENDPVINLLISAIHESQPKVQIINPYRLAELSLAKTAFDEILCRNGAKESEIKLFNMFSSASIGADVESIEVHDMAAFYSVMKYADNFEIYPLANGKMRIAFMFQHLFERLV